MVFSFIKSHFYLIINFISSNKKASSFLYTIKRRKTNELVSSYSSIFVSIDVSANWLVVIIIFISLINSSNESEFSLICSMGNEQSVVCKAVKHSININLSRLSLTKEKQIYFQNNFLFSILVE